MEWITELDAIDPSYILQSFKHTALGSLPTELLEHVIRHLDRRARAIVASVSSKVRALAERPIYRDIVISRDCWEEKNHSVLLPLSRTLSERTDLARQVELLNMTAISRPVMISMPYSSIFGKSIPFKHDLEVSLTEGSILGALLEQVLDVEDLDLSYLKWYRDGNHHEWDSPYVRDCMSTMFTGFDLKPIEDLQKVRSLKWSASHFHWVVAKSPQLTLFHLSPGCEVLADEAPSEFNEGTGKNTMAVKETLQGPQRLQFAVWC